MSPLDRIFIIISFAGFALAFFIPFSLYKYISKEKILAVKDPKTLWAGIPPKEALSEKGQDFPGWKYTLALFVPLWLNRYISMEKIHAMEDPRVLFKYSIPPKQILNEKGKKLHRLMMIGFIVFIGSGVLRFLLN